MFMFITNPCPAINASQEEWKEYARSRWERIANDTEQPDWLREYAKYVVSESK
jgi:hypothetical protein